MSSSTPLSCVSKERSARSTSPATFHPRSAPPREERRVARIGRATDERQRLIDAINQAGGKKSEAARLLGISRVTLWKLLKVHDIQVDKIIRG